MAQKKKEKVVTSFPDTIVVSYEHAGAGVNFLSVAGDPNKPAEFDLDNIDEPSKLAVYNLSHFVRVERTVKLIPVN